MKAIGIKIGQETQCEKKAEWNGYIDKPYKCVRDIGEGNFILFIELQDKYRKDQGHNEQ